MNLNERLYSKDNEHPQKTGERRTWFQGYRIGTHNANGVAQEQNEEKLSTKIVKAKLLLEEKRQLRHDTIEEEKQPTFHERRKYHPAEKTQEASTPHNYQKNTQAKAVKCFCCGKMGHIARNCRFNPAVKERFRFTENKEKAKRLLSNPDKISKQKAFFFREGNRESHLWYLDSGATEHMVSDRSKLTNIREISSVVETANKQSIHVTEMGDITFKKTIVCSKNPQQNGVSKRMNQTLLSTARCLLTESGMPITFWGDAIHTACYLRNKSSSEAIDNKIPEELWSGRESKIGYLKVFGCKSWCSIDDCHRKSKFSPKAKECVLIGYPEGTKGYKVWDFRNDKIYVTRNVRFSEDIFPCKKPNDPTKSFELDQFSTTLEEEDFYEEQLIHQREEDLQTKNPQPSTEEPSTIEEALCGPEATNWSEAIQRELQGLEEKGAWKIVPRPINKRVIDSRWVFKRKFDSYGNLREYRARLVARGFHQIPNVDFGKKYSPVIKHKSISNEVCLLKKSIYGLKQSGHEWNEKLDQILTSIGLERSRMDPCVYFSKDIILRVYVDDLLATTSSVESYVKFKSSIQREVDIKDLGEVSDLLSVRIKRNKDSNLELDQTHYIEEILKEYGMEHAKEASTPLDPGMFTEGPEGKEACRAPYQQAIGNLLWLAGMTRPDIAYAVSYLSKFNSSPLQQHWNAVKHLLRYLKKTKDLKLAFSMTGKKLAAFADADWGSDKKDRKFYSGYIFVLGGAAISWCSRKQKCVALSTAEAEYYAMCEAAKEALWFTSFMEKLEL
ncbi:hypothetical protein LAZ67_1005991, partial [Cordylochernes scorpioides]